MYAIFFHFATIQAFHYLYLSEILMLQLQFQSTENMQLWAMVAQLSTAVTRSDAEITYQRGKITKLENDLQQALAVLNRGVEDHDPLDAMKTNATILQPHTKITMNTTTIPHTKIRRERIKRGGSTGPVAIVCLPAMSQPSLVTKGRPRKARGSLGQVEEGSQLKTLVNDNASRHLKAYNSWLFEMIHAGDKNSDHCCATLLIEGKIICVANLFSGWK